MSPSLTLFPSMALVTDVAVYRKTCSTVDRLHILTCHLPLISVLLQFHINFTLSLDNTRLWLVSICNAENTVTHFYAHTG